MRLRKEMGTIVSLPMGDNDVDLPYSLSKAESVRRLLEEYGVAVEENNTVFTGCYHRNSAGSAAPPVEALIPETPQSPPSPSPPCYGEGSSSSAQTLHGVATVPADSAPTLSVPGY